MNHETHKTGNSRRLTRLGIPTALAMLVLPTVAVADEVQWTEGGNGHWYEAVYVGPDLSWSMANSLAIQSGGDLATPVTSEEDNWIISTLLSDDTHWGYNNNYAFGPHIGGWQNFDSPEYSEPGGGWEWITEETFDYSNWLGLDNCCGGQDRMQYFKLNGDIGWADVALLNDQDPLFTSYIIEWSADCNGDGIVDYGQILDGTYADNDGNGVPDICDVTITIDPYEWSTDQGGNGHWYSLLTFAGSVDPDNFYYGETPDAHFAYAESLGGHTATMASSGENAFSYALSNNQGGVLIGILKEEGNNQGGWVTGEPWSYVNWHSGEGIYSWERWGVYFTGGGGAWQDTDFSSRFMSIVEWEADCNGDGIVDYGQILDGTYADNDGNGVPDCCDAGEPCSATATNHVLELLQWPDAAVIPHHSSITPLDAMTIEFWVQADGPWGRAITKRPGNGGCYTVEANHDDVGCDAHVNIFGSCLSGGWNEIPCSWTHLAITVDGASGTTRNYENGVLVFEDVLGSECTIGQGSWDLRFGNTNGYSSTQFVGRLDNIRIWNAPLSEDDIRHWMVTDITPEIAATLPDLGGSWNFEDGVADATGINNGWLEGGAVLVEDESIFFDCNGNMIPDSQDIADGSSTDYNTNDVPDDCECLADLDQDGEVTVSDLLTVIAQWGNDDSGLGDINFDGTVGVLDVLYALNSWGVCP